MLGAAGDYLSGVDLPACSASPALSLPRSGGSAGGGAEPTLGAFRQCLPETGSGRQTGTDDERALAAFLEGYLPSLDRPRAGRAAPEQPATEDGSGQLADAMDVARLVQVDRRQRGVELSLATPEALESLRLELRDRCAGDPDVSNVRPWVWRRASSGQPLTELGRQTGYELRLSYYRHP